jgi:hypothetical protein
MAAYRSGGSRVERGDASESCGSPAEASMCAVTLRHGRSGPARKQAFQRSRCANLTSVVCKYAADFLRDALDGRLVGLAEPVVPDVFRGRFLVTKFRVHVRYNVAA